MSAHGHSRTDPDGIIQQHIDAEWDRRFRQATEAMPDGCSIISTAAIEKMESELSALREDKAVLDWLEENISYVMLGANYEAARPVAGLLLNKGTGWRDGELRNAVRVMRERDAARRGNEAR